MLPGKNDPWFSVNEPDQLFMYNLTKTALITALCASPIWGVAATPQSVARIWNERALAAIRADVAHPPGQARNLFCYSVAMYDAWAAYDTNSVGFIYHGKHTAPDIEAARHQAISYSVWRMLKERHAYSRTAGTTLQADDDQLIALGYSTSNTSRDLSTPAGVGNSVYDAVSAWFSNDGSRATNGIPFNPASPSTVPVSYPDYPVADGGYVYTNPALAVGFEGITDGAGNTVVDINRWQRLQLVNAIDQNGFPVGPIQGYLGAQWLRVRPYQLARLDASLPWVDPGPPPFFDKASHAQFVKEVVAVITASGQLTVDDGVTIDISPGAAGNNSLDYAGKYGDGSLELYDGTGHPVNPITGQPYTPNLVKRGDFVRALSEFWADGPNSETPPGHWNVVANGVSDDPLTVKKIGGVGPVVNDLEWDVKVYFALNAATHEAACACWSVKRFYDGWRPLSAIRYLSGLGQSSDSTKPSYNPKGLPLIPGQIELVSAATAGIGGRHEGLEPGKIALLAWPGETPQRTEANGVRFVQGESWITYQRTNFVTPPFPGYISGHSTFSRSAAEVMTSFTGSKYYPGGIGKYPVTTLANEKGPSAPFSLTYATYYDAADGAGLSRIYGGIHPPIDNIGGRRVGEMTGKGVWETARKYFDGTIASTPINLVAKKLNESKGEVQYNTIRGMYYKLQGAANPGGTYTDVPGTAIYAVNSSVAITNAVPGSGTNFFYRAVRSLTPN